MLELTYSATFSDFKFLQLCSESIREAKDQLFGELAPFLVKALESRAFWHLTGKPLVTNHLNQEDLDEDYSVVFDSLGENEYEFFTLLMEPKTTIREKIEELTEESPSPISATHRQSIFESLKRSKFVYESQITKMTQENQNLQEKLLLCQNKLFELGLNYQG